VIQIIERYNDWYCEEKFSAYLNNSINLAELLHKLDYEQVCNQKELFDFLNLILTKKFPHNCYNKYCREKLYFSNTFDYAKKQLSLKLKEFVKIWIAPQNLEKFSWCRVNIPFYCCKCFKEKIVREF